MLVLLSLTLALTPVVLACDMCKMGFNIDHSQQGITQQGMSGTGQQNNLDIAAAQQKIQELEQNNKMMESMVMMMWMEKMMKHNEWENKGPGTRLAVYQQNVTYVAAENKCWAAGGLLAMPFTPEVTAQVMAAIEQAGGVQGFGYWIGLKARESSVKDFVWSNGVALSGWTNWGPNQPNNFDGRTQDCVTLRLMEGRTNVTSGFNGWNDQECDQRRGFICQITQTTETQQVCQGFADVVFVVDSSGSIGEENYIKQMRFIGDVAGKFQLSQNDKQGYQVSVVTFSDDVREEFPLNRFNSTTDMREEIGSVRYVGGGTNTHKALEFVNDQSFSSNRGSRNDAVKIVIVLTDGRSSRSAETIAKANEMRRKKLMVLAVGVGSNIDERELQQIASSDKNVFLAASTDVLDTIKAALQNRACSVTVEQGGAVMDGATEQQKQEYAQFVAEKKRLEQEYENQLQILENIRAFKNHEKPVNQTVEVTEEEEKEKMQYMQASIKKAMSELEQYHQMEYSLTEMHHEFLYLVAHQMIRFCPLSSEHMADVMKYVGHGDSTWTPGDQDECNVEDLADIDTNDDPMIIAQQMATMEKVDQIKMFFSGLKSSVCDGMLTYMRQVKTWENNHPEFSNLLM